MKNSKQFREQPLCWYESKSCVYMTGGMKVLFSHYHLSCVLLPSSGLVTLHTPPLIPQSHKCVSDLPGAAYTFNNRVTPLLAWVDVVEHETWHIIALLDYQCECLCICVYLGGLPVDTHPLTPPSWRWLVATATVSPLFLMLLWDSDRQTWAEWQCVCGSGKRPTGTNKRRCRDEHFPVWDHGRDCLGCQEPSRYVSSFVAALNNYYKF